MTPPRLSILVVSFSTRDLLGRCLESIQRFPPPAPFETIVIDNASTDGSADLVASRFPGIRLIRNDRNLGYGAAHNRGLQAAGGEVVLFLNSDTELLPGSLAPLLKHLDEYPRVGVVGPAEQLVDGSLYPTICPPPDLLFMVLAHTGLRRRFNTSSWINPYREIWERAIQTGRPVPVGWLSGASLMVRRRVLEQVGPFDEGYFFYMEETDLCERARRAGWGVEFVPEGRLMHHGGGSSDKAKGGLLTLSGTVSELRYFCKHRSRIDLLFLKGLLFAEFTLKLLLARSSDPRRWAYREILAVVLGLRLPQITKGDLCRR